MPIPLVWLGAGAAALYASTRVAREVQKSKGYINHFPGECHHAVEPVCGSIVCCGIYEVFQHTGVWVDGNIIELRGNGLIRAVSPQRFLEDRSGNRIYVACDDQRKPLVAPGCSELAASRLFEYSEYDVIKNNCHRFTLSCVNGYDEPITLFSELNAGLQTAFHQPIHWQPILNQ